MKWRLEYITPDSAIILVEDGTNGIDSEVVGIGFPLKLAERIVSMHNKVVDELLGE